MSYLFLLDDLDALDKKINENKKRLSEALKRIGDSCDEGGDTWHDNFAFEQAQRDAEIWSHRIRDLNSIRREAAVVYADDFEKGFATIGKLITIVDIETGEEKKFRIGSYMVVDESKESISYVTPLANLIMNAREGEIKEGKIGGKKRKFKILKIE